MIYGILNCAAWLANAGQSFVINTVTVGCARAHPHHIAYSSSVVVVVCFFVALLLLFVVLLVEIFYRIIFKFCNRSNYSNLWPTKKKMVASYLLSP